MSGDYLCKVSTFENEDFDQEKLVIYGEPVLKDILSVSALF